MSTPRSHPTAASRLTRRLALPALAVLALAACETELPPLATEAPAVSADRGMNLKGKIVYASGPVGFAKDLYVIDLDGLGVTRLTYDGLLNVSPSWSPNGKRIAFASDRDDPYYDIYVMNADGTEITRLTERSGADWLPAWSAQGKRLAFTSDRTGGDEIWSVYEDGTGLVQLTGLGSPTELSADAWGGNGKQIVFANSDGIHIMDADGTNLVQLTTPADGIATDPALSPNGKQIAFAKGSIGDYDLYLMNTDGTGLTRLTNSPGNDVAPAWSANGKQIAFASDRDGDYDIYVMNVDGSGLTQVTNDPSSDGAAGLDFH